MHGKLAAERQSTPSSTLEQSSPRTMPIRTGPMTPVLFRPESDAEALSPAHVMSLQARLGNRATLRLLSGTVQRQGVEAQLSLTPPPGVTDVPAAEIHARAAEGLQTPTSALPYRAELEPLFGNHLLERVQAHTGPDAGRSAAGMKASAFTVGEHVILGPSPSLHTVAHELAHVEQQRAGVQLIDGVGRSGDSYERQADAVADRAVARQPITSLLPTLVGGANPGGEEAPSTIATPGVQGKAIQREVVAQIIPGGTPAEPRIAQLLVAGRPDRLFGASMGDHTTAFSFHVAAVRAAIEGKTVPEAVTAMNALVDALEALPGMRLVDGLPDEMKARFILDRLTLKLARRKADAMASGRQDPAQLPMVLQDYVAAYLTFREVIPLSAVNVAWYSQGTAGKGKGESGPINALLEAERDPSRGLDLTAAILGTFDASAAGLASAVMGGSAERIAPGLQGVDPVLRPQLYADQHLASVAASFPRTFESLPPGSTAKLQAYLVASIHHASAGRVAQEVERLLSAIQTQGERVIAARDNVHIDRTKAAQQAPLTETETLATLTEQLSSLLGLEGVPDALRGAALSMVEKSGKLAAGDDSDWRPSGRQKRRAATQPSLGSKRAPETDGARKKPRPAQKDDLSEEEDEEAAAVNVASEDEEVLKQPLVHQIRLAGNGTVQELRSEGRSPSPFSGSMGAHTTAWVLHKEEVLRAIVGKRPGEALAVVARVLWPKAQERGRALMTVFGPNERHVQGLREAEAQLDEHLRTAPPDELPALQVLHLQQCVTWLLTYINFTPGSTLEAVNTDGRGEAEHLSVLRAFEDRGEGSPGGVKRAIDGLFDLATDVSGGQKKALWLEHCRTLWATFPKASAAAKLPRPG